MAGTETEIETGTETETEAKIEIEAGIEIEVEIIKEGKKHIQSHLIEAARVLVVKRVKRVNWMKRLN